MYFFGKIIGVILGFKWGGFFGAIAGLILGSIADKKLYEMGSVNSSFFKKKTTRQALFMQTTFAVLGHLSKSKGRVTVSYTHLHSPHACLLIELKIRLPNSPGYN